LGSETPSASGDEYEQILQNSPFDHLIRQMENFVQEGDPWLYVRRRLTVLKARLDFPILTESRPALPIISRRWSASVLAAVIGVAVLWNAPTQETADGD
jgi:hypothetical protein